MKTIENCIFPSLKKEKKSAVRNSNASKQLHFLRRVGAIVTGKYSNLALKHECERLKTDTKSNEKV